MEARKKFTRIDCFEGMFAFLALDSPHQACWDTDVYQTAQHAILAAQYPGLAKKIQDAQTAEEALQLVDKEKKKVEADDWKTNAGKIMEHIQRDKFRRSPDLQKQLLDTGDRELAWENKNDTFFGVTNARGQNHLGRALCEVRDSIKDGTELEAWLFHVADVESDPNKRPPIVLIESKEEDGRKEKKAEHKLEGKPYFKLGKLPTCNVVALHPSVSREHAMIIHTKAKSAQQSGGVTLMDMGSKAGTSVGAGADPPTKLQNPFVLKELRSGDTIVLGASTRTYTVNIDVSAQIAELERQEREILKEVQLFEGDVDDPLAEAKRIKLDESTVFVGNLSYDTAKPDMLGFFADCGEVDEVRFPGDDETKATRGIAFVIFKDPLSARRGIGLNGTEMFERKIKVAPAMPGQASREKGDGKGKGKGKGDGKGKGKSKGKGKGKSRSRSRGWSRGRSPSNDRNGRDREGDRRRDRDDDRGAGMNGRDDRRRSRSQQRRRSPSPPARKPKRRSPTPPPRRRSPSPPARKRPVAVDSDSDDRKKQKKKDKKRIRSDSL